jgi:hypothetical protein
MTPTERDPLRRLGTTPPPPHPASPSAQPIPVGRPAYRWYHKLSAAVLIALCIEIGLFLLVFPWMTDYWDNNYFSTILPGWRRYWMNPYWRGAISGLGLANLFLAGTEILRLRRFRRFGG